MLSPRRIRMYFMFAILAVWALSACECPAESGLGGTRHLEASPDSLTFDAQEGEEQEKLVRIIAKVGTTRIESIELIRGKDYFSIVDGLPTEFPFDLEEGQEIRLKVKYKAPGGNASPIGTIRALSDSSIPAEGKLDIQLLAQSNDQRLRLTPNPVSFGAVKDGESKTITVTGENIGSAILKMENIVPGASNSPAFSFEGLPKVPKEVAPGETFTFKVTYKPTPRKPDLGTLDFSCKGNCSPVDPEATNRKDPFLLKLNGTLAAPSLKVEPLTLDFGVVEAGNTVSKKFKMTNNGSALLEISEIALKAGSSGAFLMPTISNIIIEPGSSKEVAVQYRPSTGSEDKGTIEVKSNDGARPVVPVQLIGKVSAPNIQVSPTTLNFGRVGAKKVLNVNITNTGDKPLVVDPAVMVAGTSPEFSFEKAPTQLTIPPNGVEKLAVVYTPKDKVDDVGKIQIKSNDPDTPTVEVILKGQGTGLNACDLVPAPTQVNFGTIVLGKTKTVSVKFTNQGNVDCKISTITTFVDRGIFPVAYQGPNPFVLPSLPAGCPTGTCNPPLEVKAGNSITIDVSFTPLLEKENKLPIGGSNDFTGGLDLAINATPSKKSVPLRGLPAKSCIEAVPTTIDFGLVQTNCSSRNEKLDIYNTCDKDITVSKFEFTSTNSTQSSEGFSIVKMDNLPFTIKPLQSAQISLKYTAKAPVNQAQDAINLTHTVTIQSPLAIPLAANETTTADQTDTFKQSKRPKIDILFVVDNSGSMGNEQQSLGNNFTSFIKWALTLNVDFQIGVTTTDVKKNNPLGGTGGPGELYGSPKIMTNNTPNLETIFRQNATVGTGGSSDERGLEAARLALSPPTITTGTNKGFLRKDASLSVIVISDEADGSSQPVQYYLNFFLGIKGVRNKDLFRFHGIIGYDPATKKNQCQGSGGQGVSTGRYLSMIQSTGGVVASICNANWSQTLSNIGTVIFGLKRQFFLTRAADPKSIVVKVDGVVVNTSATTWTYDPINNSIDFDKAPKAGSTIQVEYKAICF